MIFAEWKMTGYFLEVYHGAGNGGFQVGRAQWEQRRNSGDFVWSVFDATGGFDWRSFISVFLSLFPLLMRLSLDLTDCLMMPLRRFSLSPSLLFGLICFFCSTFL